MVLLFGIFTIAAHPATAAWTDCPSPFGTLDCDDPGWDICVWSSANNRIECTGSANNDEIIVVEEGGKPWAYGTVDGTDFCCDSTDMTYTGVEVFVGAGSGNDIVCLHDQDNPIDGCDGYATGIQVWDGPGDLRGGNGIDHLDTAETGDHDDYVDGGAGADKIFTYDGEDEIYAQGGDDVVYAGDKADDVWGGAGNDTIYGGAGDDDLEGDEGDDWLYGNEGDDVLNGGDDEDRVYGGPGSDEACGDASRDYVYGDANDNDCVCGGNSTNNADGALDYLYGGGGTGDTCTGDDPDSYDTVTCETYGNGNCTCGC